MAGQCGGYLRAAASAPGQAARCRRPAAAFSVFGSALISSLKKGGRLSVRLKVKTCLRTVRVIVRRRRASMQAVTHMAASHPLKSIMGRTTDPGANRDPGSAIGALRSGSPLTASKAHKPSIRSLWLC